VIGSVTSQTVKLATFRAPAPSVLAAADWCR